MKAIKPGEYTACCRSESCDVWAQVRWGCCGWRYGACGPAVQAALLRCQSASVDVMLGDSRERIGE